MPKTLRSKPHQVLIAELVAARKAAGMTQQELATKLGRPQSFVAKYENGERRLDVIEFLMIAEILGARMRGVLSRVSKALG